MFRGSVVISVPTTCIICLAMRLHSRRLPSRRLVGNNTDKHWKTVEGTRQLLRTSQSSPQLLSGDMFNFRVLENQSEIKWNRWQDNWKLIEEYSNQVRDGLIRPFSEACAKLYGGVPRVSCSNTVACLTRLFTSSEKVPPPTTYRQTDAAIQDAMEQTEIDETVAKELVRFVDNSYDAPWEPAALYDAMKHHPKSSHFLRALGRSQVDMLQKELLSDEPPGNLPRLFVPNIAWQRLRPSALVRLKSGLQGWDACPKESLVSIFQMVRKRLTSDAGRDVGQLGEHILPAMFGNEQTWGQTNEGKMELRNGHGKKLFPLDKAKDYLLEACKKYCQSPNETEMQRLRQKAEQAGFTQSLPNCPAVWHKSGLFLLSAFLQQGHLFALVKRYDTTAEKYMFELYQGYVSTSVADGYELSDWLCSGHRFATPFDAVGVAHFSKRLRQFFDDSAWPDEERTFDGSNFQAIFDAMEPAFEGLPYVATLSWATFGPDNATVSECGTNPAEDLLKQREESTCNRNCSS